MGLRLSPLCLVGDEEKRCRNYSRDDIGTTVGIHSLIPY